MSTTEVADIPVQVGQREPEQPESFEQELRPGTLRCGCKFTIVLRGKDHVSDGVAAMNEHIEICPNRAPQVPTPPRPPEAPVVAVFRTVFENVFSTSTAWMIVAVGVAVALFKYANVIFG